MVGAAVTVTVLTARPWSRLPAPPTSRSVSAKVDIMPVERAATPIADNKGDLEDNFGGERTAVSAARPGVMTPEVTNGPPVEPARVTKRAGMGSMPVVRKAHTPAKPGLHS